MSKQMLLIVVSALFFALTGMLTNLSVFPVLTGIVLIIAVGLLAPRLSDRKREESTKEENEVSEASYRLLERKFKEASQKAEKLEHDKKMTELFLASMSHEIRTPLNGIIGLTEVLDGMDLNKEQKEFVSMIRESSNNLRVIVDDVLEISKLNAGKMELESIPFDLASKIKSSAGLFMARANEKEIALTTTIDSRLPAKVKGDPTRFTQVLTNLISNALKFTPAHGKIDVSASFIRKEGDAVTMRVAVSDTGIGLSKEQQERIFDAYSQASASTTRQAGGTGLGLTISKKIIHSMGGELSVESEEGKGATFYFVVTLPVVEEETNRSLQEEASHEHHFIDETGSALKVLVAEDNPINQKLIRIVLEKMGMQVTLADNGEQALEARKQNRFDLIFMDVQMPVMGGVEATHEILAYEKSQGEKHIPIIALTANALPGDREKYIREGMDDYATKPLDVKVIESLIEKYCHTV